MSDKALSLLGLMRRAGAIEIGEDNSADAVHAGKAKLLLLSSDLSDKARHRAEGYTYGHRTLIVPLDYTKEELANSLGIGMCSMAAVTDIGFADTLMKQLAEQQPEKYGSLREETEKRCRKAERRRRETAARKGDKRNVKRRTEV